MQALVRFNFCWRALNWWPILEGPLFLPLRSCGQTSSDTNKQRQRSNSFTNCAPLRNVHIPICPHRLQYFNCYRSRACYKVFMHGKKKISYMLLHEILNNGCSWHGGGRLFRAFSWCTLAWRTVSHWSAAWHSPGHRWTLAQELLIKEHVRTAPSCHPCESQHLQPSHTLLDAAVLMKGA